MKYIKPNYENEKIEAYDILLASGDEGNGAVLTEKDPDSANITTSIFDVL